MIPAPILVVGPPGPNLSRLAAMLGRHPQACDLPELNACMAPTLLGLLEIGRLSDGLSSAGLKRALARLFEGRDDADAIIAAERWLARRQDWTPGLLFAALGDRLAPRALVSADGTLGWRPDFIDRLLDAVPDVRLIHLLEHPRVWCSERERTLRDRLFIAPDDKDYGVNPPVLDPQLGWLRAHVNLIAASAWLPVSQYRRVSYESLQRTPDPELAALCDWLGWSATPAALAAMQQPELSPFAIPGPDGARYGVDERFIADPRFLRRLRLAERLDGPLPWRPDAQGFAAEVQAIAGQFGYV